MPVKKYRVETDKGNFEVEVDEPGLSPSDVAEGIRHGDADTIVGHEGPKSGADKLGMEMFEHAAHPQSTADLLGLVVGSGSNEIIPSVIKGLKTAGRSIVNASKTNNTSMLQAVIKGLAQDAKTVKSPFNTVDGEAFQQQLTNELPVYRQQPMLERAGTTRATGPVTGSPRTAVPPIPSHNVNDLPLYMQEEMMRAAPSHEPTNFSGSSRMADPPHVVGSGTHPPPPAPKAPLPQVRLAGKAPTVNESLESVMSDMMGPEKPGAVSGAPPVETAGAGPLKQSGKFGKSGQKGQAGGYTSGNPAQTVGQFDAGTELAHGRISTHGWTQEDWAAIRRQMGARDAGTLTGKTAEEVRQLSGGGPSRTPTDALDRIEAANRLGRRED